MPSKDPIGREVLEVVLTMCEDFATPRALTVAILLRHREYRQLVNLTVDPSRYTDPHSYWLDVTVTSLLRKCGDLPTGIDLAAEAVSKFHLAESQCYKSNERLSPLLFDTWSYGEGVRSVIELARKKIESWIGPKPPLTPLYGRFGPGATFGDRGQLVTVPDKMSSSPTLTRGALWFYLFEFTGTAWYAANQDASLEPTFIRGNRFTTVPKDGTTDRGICIEPSINVFYQLAGGKILRSRLRGAGIDLQHGQSTHRLVAREASLSGSMATIDLSSASDTVCKNLVKLLLPPDWFSFLDELRSPLTQVNGKWHYLEKFSSMGNGFTFELETLIFLAISAAIYEANGLTPVIGKDLLVYGDDILVLSRFSSDVLAALRFFGFTPNPKKTFSEGPFRESCGGDFFDGVDVRPYFLKELPSEPQHYIAWANGIRRLALDESDAFRRLGLVRRCWFRILDAIPTNVRCLRGPEGLGDLVIHDDESRWITRTENSIRYVKCYKPARFKRIGWGHWRPDVVLAAALYGTGDGSRGRKPGEILPDSAFGVTPRDAVLGYKVGWTAYS